MTSHPRALAGPVSWRVAFLAGFLDQMAFLGIIVFCIGIGLLRAETSGGSGAAAGIGIGIGGLGVLIGLFVQIRLMVRHGTSAGLFLLGIRFDPRDPVHWFDDAADWLLTFWRNVVFAPLAWLVNKMSRSSNDEQDSGFVPDPRAHSGGGRLARAALALLLLATPLPFVLAVLA